MRWTPDKVERLRELAAARYSIAQAAGEIGCSTPAAGRAACAHRIKFVKQPNARKPQRAWPSARVADFASPGLRAEIEAAKREAPTAPLYRGGSWA